MSSLWHTPTPSPQPQSAAASAIVVPQAVPLMDQAPVRPRAAAAKSAPEASPLPRLLLQVLDVLTQGLALLDADGQVLYANSAAVQACAGNSGLCLEGQVAAAGADRKRLARAVDRAARGQWSMLILGGEPADQADEAACPGAAHRAARGATHTADPAAGGTPAGERRVVGLVPLAGDPSCPDVAMLLVIGAEPGASALAMHFFCEQFGITTAERHVLMALGQGAKPADIAREKGVALCTVRTQVAHLRQKVDVPDIGQLLRVMLSLPPVAQPLRMRMG